VLVRVDQWCERPGGAEDRVEVEPQLFGDRVMRTGAGRVDVDTALQTAITVAQTQISNWEQAGYAQEEIDAMTTTGEFDRWCIETAAQLGKQAQVHVHALGKL